MSSHLACQIGIYAMASELGWRRPSVFGDEDYCREIVAAYNAKHGGTHAR